MARLPRIIIPQCPHHVTQRGNRRQKTFFCDEDYEYYLKILARQCQRFKVEVLAYCLMPNHVHIVLVPRCRSVIQAIGSTHEMYTKSVNLREGWQGHLWQGRFFSVPLDEEYLINCVKYVELNPVRAGLCNSPFDYEWSSAKAHLTGKDDRIVKVQPMLRRCNDWRHYLETPDNEDVIKEIRLNSRTGRPLGNENFLTRLEHITNLSLKRKKTGPKRRE